MNQKLLKYSLYSLPLVFILIGQACSDTKLSKSQLSQASTADIGFCTTPAQSIQSNLKYIFVFDHSGSNQQNFVQDPVTKAFIPDNGGSDSDGNKRFPPLISFLNSIPDNNFTFYSVVNFSDSAALGLNWVGSGGRTTSLQAQNYLSAEQTRVPGSPPHPADGGGTNYNAALDIIINMISSDVAAAKSSAALGVPIVSTDYVVFWVSDGAPYVSGALQDLASITGKVKTLLSLRDADSDYIDSITLNTGFYHVFHNPASSLPLDVYGVLQDQQSSQYMSAMATAGQGVFIDFENAVIDYTKFSVPLRSVKFQLKDIWMQNANTVWWNGQIKLDSDADGLPDEVEITLGSNPNVYDSDGNGAGDGVEYYLFGKPCKDSKCSVSGAASYNTQCGAMPTGGYRDFDMDFLNDCEEKLLGSRFDDFDSNQDYVPDQFAWINKVGFVPGVLDLLSDPEGDGVTNYFELKSGMPTQYANSLIKGLEPTKYSAQIISDTPAQTCYHLNVDHITTLSAKDLVRVYLMEARGAVGTHRQLRVAQKRITGSSLILKDSDFIP